MVWAVWTLLGARLGPVYSIGVALGDAEAELLGLGCSQHLQEETGVGFLRPTQGGAEQLGTTLCTGHLHSEGETPGCAGLLPKHRARSPSPPPLAFGHCE